MPGRGCLPWSPEGAVSEDWPGGQPAPGPRRCLQWVEESLHLPVPVHPLIYWEKKGHLPAAPLPPSLLMDPWTWTPSSVLHSTQRQNPAKGGCSSCRSCGRDLEQRQGQVTFLERKPPLHCNCCPQLSFFFSQIS